MDCLCYLYGFILYSHYHTIALASTTTIDFVKVRADISKDVKSCFENPIDAFSQTNLVFSTNHAFCTTFDLQTFSEASHGHLWISPEAKRKLSDSRCTSKHFPFQFGRSRYGIVRRNSKWFDAANFCKERGSKLLQISTVEERKFVMKLIRDAGITDDGLHVGLMKSPGVIEPHKGWFWYPANDTETPSSDLWSKNEPSNQDGNEIYGELLTKSGKLNDIQEYQSKAICECFWI